MNRPTVKMHAFKLENLLTVEDLAKKLKVSTKTVRTWVYKRRIPFTRFQRRVYFELGVVEGMLNANAVDALGSSMPPIRKAKCQGGAALGKVEVPNV